MFLFFRKQAVQSRKPKIRILEGRRVVFALILETLSTTELFFILVIALIFFGPRKLPQLARSVGKSLADFRKASEDFKHQWDREVALETARIESATHSIESTAHDMFDLESDNMAETPVDAAVEPVDAELVVARDGSAQGSSDQAETASEFDEEKNTATTNSRKPDWL
jgi:Tat protein translocase TatB subunit